MAAALLSTILAILLALPAAGWAAGPLEERLQHWPDWSLPAPLPRPGRGDLVYPFWFAGHWSVTERDPDSGRTGDPPLGWEVDFRPDRRGRIVADRAANAAAIGRALLGPALLRVEQDPADPNRQLARLRDGGLLESTVIGRRTEAAGAEGFLADELSLQVLHGPGDPRVLRVETLSRYKRLADGGIAATQWQATYPSPAAGLRARPLASSRHGLRLDPRTPESCPAS
ncbi:MAG: DUF6816 family protein [Prochlorococcaceae cyanobacterium]|jgi:hypothetical protein